LAQALGDRFGGALNIVGFEENFEGHALRIGVEYSKIRWPYG
jgi:hypothetical protein